MTEQTYSLQPNGPVRLRLSWEGSFKHVKVVWDDNLLGEIPNKTTMVRGKHFRLPAPDGRELYVKLNPSFNTPRFVVLVDSEPVPGSDSSNDDAAKRVSGIAYFIGVVNLIVGVLIIFSEDSAKGPNVVVIDLIVGTIFILFGWLIRNHQRWAVLATAVFLGLDGIIGLFEPDSFRRGAMILLRFMFVFKIVQAWRQMEPSIPVPYSE
jgi:hypothetical protein